jgi:hypothetical protein
MTPTPSQEPVASNPQILKAYKLGFLRAAEWVNRDDLRADLDSGAYAKDRARDLGPMLLQAAPVAASEPSDALRNAIERVIQCAPASGWSDPNVIDQLRAALAAALPVEPKGEGS